jgi:hypothetical protein
MSDRLNVIVIGGSETAKQLILDFISRSFVQVVGVADVDPEGPAAKLAQRYGVPFTTDIHDFASIEPAPDVVIDVCGRPHVNPALEETFASPEAGGPAIVHDTVARLLISVAADATDLVPSCAVRSADR